MLGLSWTELLVIGVVALIVIGPQELPTVMKKVGQFVGQIRRMGNEFQRELNRTTGLDEVRNLRNAISDPLRKTADEIRKEFNTMTPSGPKPSGAIKPKDPKAESVADEIKAMAGMSGAAAAAAAASEGQGDADQPAAQPTLAAAANPAVEKTPPAKPARAKSAAAPRPRRKPAAAADAAEAPAKPATRKPRKSAAATPAEDKPAPRRRTSRKAMELEADAATPAENSPAEPPKPARRRRKTAEGGDIN